MCRSTDHDGNAVYRYPAYRPRRLKVTSISLELSTSTSSASATAMDPLPEFLTLLFLPRINDSPLDVNGSKIRPDTPAFLTLHRLPTSNNQRQVVFACNNRLRLSDGLSFEVHLAQHRFLRGIFRNSDDDDDDDWRIECKCVLDTDVVALHVAQAELSVALEGQTHVIKDRVAVNRKRGSSTGGGRRRRRCRTFQTFLEEIPEETGRDIREAQLESDGNFCCCCSCSDTDYDENPDAGSPFDDVDAIPIPKDDVVTVDMDVDVDGVKWAVDVGFWVMCFGVGFLVSRASARNFRRRKFLL